MEIKAPKKPRSGKKRAMKWILKYELRTGKSVSESTREKLEAVYDKLACVEETAGVILNKHDIVGLRRSPYLLFARGLFGIHRRCGTLKPEDIEEEIAEYAKEYAKMVNVDILREIANTLLNTLFRAWEEEQPRQPRSC